MSDAAILLAIDTCTRRSSVALSDPHAIRAECTWEAERRHTAAVSARIRDLMRSSGIQPADIGALAVATGPGSFTGVRCGLAIAKGFAVARGLPLIGVSAFEIIATAQPERGMPIVALIEAGRSRVAAGRFEWRGSELTAAGEWRICSHQVLAESLQPPAWVCGDVAPALAGLLESQAELAPPLLNLRRAGVLAEIGRRRWLSGQVDDPATLMPIYPPERA